jgi:hypothetical protein
MRNSKPEPSVRLSLFGAPHRTIKYTNDTQMNYDPIDFWSATVEARN